MSTIQSITDEGPRCGHCLSGRLFSGSVPEMVSFHSPQVPEWKRRQIALGAQENEGYF